MSAELTFRRVKMEDLWTLFAWRLEQQTAFWSLGQPPTIEKHANWMCRAIIDENMYIAENENWGPIAVFSAKDGEISITVNPLARSKGYGTACIEFLQCQYDRLTAVVVVGNTHSLRLFVKCGFEMMDAQIVKHRPCVILEWRKADA